MHRLAVLVEDLDLHAQAAALDLAAPDRQRRIAEPKQDTMSVPPEIDDRQTSLLDLAVDVVEALRRQRRAGGEDGAQRGEVNASCAASGRAWQMASMNLAEVPNWVMRSASAEIEQDAAVAG